MSFSTKPQTIISAQAVTGANSYTSTALHVRRSDCIGVTFVWTGTPVGSFDFQVSNDYDADAGTGTWTSLTLTTSPTSPAGSASNTAVALALLPFDFLRVVYTNTSGTGVMNAYAQRKGL